MINRTRWATALLVVVATAAPAAAPELAAEQVNLDTSMLLALGGSVDQQLAQAFVLDEKGYVSHLMLPMSCQPKSTVLVTLEKTTLGVPNGSVLAYQEVPGHVFTSYPTPAVGMRMVEFEKPALLGPGVYALTLTVKDGDCVVYVGPNGNTYPGGAGYFIASGNPPGWIELFDAGGIRDMAFQVYRRDP